MGLDYLARLEVALWEGLYAAEHGRSVGRYVDRHTVSSGCTALSYR
jgi:hypothetical protein